MRVQMFETDGGLATRLTFRCHDKGHDQTVQTKYLSENQNQNHTDVQSKDTERERDMKMKPQSINLPWLLSRSSYTSITDNTHSETCC